MMCSVSVLQVLQKSVARKRRGVLQTEVIFSLATTEIMSALVRMQEAQCLEIPTLIA